MTQRNYCMSCSCCVCNCWFLTSISTSCPAHHFSFQNKTDPTDVEEFGLYTHAPLCSQETGWTGTKQNLLLRRVIVAYTIYTFQGFEFNVLKIKTSVCENRVSCYFLAKWTFGGSLWVWGFSSPIFFLSWGRFVCLCLKRKGLCPPICQQLFSLFLH